MTILVTGATGNVGRHVVNHLLQSGQRVRVLLRDRAAVKNLPPEVEPVYGNLTQPETLIPALEGVTGMHLMTMASGEILKTGAEIIELATKAGVKRVTVMWSGERGPVEPIVEASDLEWTQLQPVEFMSNALLWADSIRSEGVVREPFPNNLNAMIHEADIGAVAAKALVEEGHAGKTYTLTGPEALTIPDKIRIISDAIGRDIRFIELTKEQARERLIKSGVDDDMADHVIGWYENPPKHAYTVVPTVEEITGRSARTFTQWASEHIADFS
jgi:uncharacterized protein YbjT (DUF2867 family)